MELLSTIFTFLKNVLFISFGQFFSLLAVFFFFGLILYLLARFTRIVFIKSIGQKFDIYITGWLGVPIHELGHAIFCIPFGHRITDIKLFSPNSSDGSLGYVNHSYNPNNPWHKIGNFFIGFGPILFGSFIIYLLIRYIVPDNSIILELSKNRPIDLSSFAGIKDQFIQIYVGGKQVVENLFSSENIRSWEFWVFLYAAMCIASHMELSPPDLKGVLSGIISIFVLLIVINAISLFFNINISAYIQHISNYTNMVTGIFTISTIISALFFLSSYIVLNIFTLIRYRKAFHPFA